MSNNIIILTGFLGKDPDITHFDNGNKTAVLNMAVSDDYKGKDGEWVKRTYWHRIVAWNKLADTPMIKGNKITVVGKSTLREYEDATKVKRTIHEVVAHSIEVCVVRAREDVPAPMPEGRYFNDPESRDKEAEKENFKAVDDTPF